MFNTKFKTMKTNMNKVELIGYAGTEAEVLELKNNVKMTRLTVATHDGYYNKEGKWVDNTVWHKVVIWSANENNELSNIQKGDKLSVQGKMQYRTYETNKGEKKYVAEVVANRLKVIPRIV